MPGFLRNLQDQNAHTHEIFSNVWTAVTLVQFQNSELFHDEEGVIMNLSIGAPSKEPKQ